MRPSFFNLNKKFVSLGIIALLFVVFLFYGMNLKAAANKVPQWQAYQQRFIEKGRIIDTGNPQKISHSEGQGYGLILASFYQDRDAFNAIWQWTQKNLQTRQDALFSWSWSPESGQVTDPNNASDGDLLIAWGLLRGFDLWHDETYQNEARKILGAIKQKLIYTHSFYGKMLLPGEYGFLDKDKQEIVINLSYWVFPALQRFAEFEPNEPLWPELIANGKQLLKIARFGQWNLPADWVRFSLTSRNFDLETRYAPRFSYDALRIPLYLKWAHYEDSVLFEPFQKFWGQFQGRSTLPAWTDLKTQEVDPLNANMAVRSIIHLVAPNIVTTLPADNPQESYYNSTLYLFSTQLAQTK